MDFVVYFFAALIKHEIHVKYEKCMASVSYFVVCFAKTVAKYPQNEKYEKYIAGLRGNSSSDVTGLHSLFSVLLLLGL